MFFASKQLRDKLTRFSFCNLLIYFLNPPRFKVLLSWFSKDFCLCVLRETWVVDE